MQDHRGAIRTCASCQLVLVLKRPFSQGSFELARVGENTNFSRFGAGIYTSATSSKVSIVYLGGNKAIICAGQRLFPLDYESNQRNASQRCCNGEDNQAYKDEHKPDNGAAPAFLEGFSWAYAQHHHSHRRGTIRWSVNLEGV